MEDNEYTINPDTLRTFGREIKGETYEELKACLDPGEYIFGLYDWGLFTNAICLITEEWYSNWDIGTVGGKYKLAGYYALTEHHFKSQCFARIIFSHISHGFFSRNKARNEIVKKAEENQIKVLGVTKTNTSSSTIFTFTMHGKVKDMEKFEEWKKSYLASLKD